MTKITFCDDLCTEKDLFFVLSSWSWCTLDFTCEVSTVQHRQGIKEEWYTFRMQYIGRR